jgi:SAM-dependent methyltransferase
MERHRLVWLFINRKIGLQNISKKQSLLHVAAEAVLEQKLRPLIGKKYLTADLYEQADVRMDIADIQYPDQTFNIIIANHILEHVHDDIKAMRELFRVQKNDGWAVLLVPIADIAITHEDKRITSKKGRFEAYGQEDHVRKYGRDYIDRLRGVGYKVGRYKAKDIASRKEIARMSLTEKGSLRGFLVSDIYVCLKDSEAVRGLEVC